MTFESQLLAARAFLGTHPSLTWETTGPRDLDELLGRLGFGALQIEAGSQRHGGLRRTPVGWTPVVYRNGLRHRPLSPRERFTVAHEIAHALVEDAFGIRPARSREYWGLEGVCDAYAADLLLPAAAPLAADLDSPSQLADAIASVAVAYDVSLAVSARRLVSLAEECAAWGLRELDERVIVAWDAESRGQFGIRTARRVDRGTSISVALPGSAIFVGDEHEAVLADGSRTTCRRLRNNFLLLVALGNQSCPKVKSEELLLFS